MRFVAMRDVPDVLGFADFAHRPDLTLGLVRERINSDTLFIDQRSFPLPKPDGSSRGLTVINPIAELALRTYVGRCSGALRNSIDEHRVLNGLIRRPGPGWFSADFKDQHRLRRRLQRRYYHADETQAVGFLDVQKFYPSCRHDWLSDHLEAIGAPLGATHVLVTMLSRLFPSGVGLPIGFEGSGPLANIFLRPLDEALVNEGVEFVRWTDDVDVFLSSAEKGPDLLRLAADTLAAAHLHLNAAKSEVLAKGPDAERRLLDPARDSILAGDAIENIKSRLELEAWMKEWGVTQEMPPAHLRTWLRVLRGQSNPSALEFLSEFPHWIDRESRAVGDYLTELARNPKSRSALDPDWMLDRAIGRTPSTNASAGQLHMCRALAEYRLDRDRAKQLFDFATQSGNLRRHSVVGAWAVRAWSASNAWTKSDAMSLVDTVAVADYRRSALFGFIDRVPANTVALRDRARSTPEIGPTIEFVLAA